MRAAAPAPPLLGLVARRRNEKALRGASFASIQVKPSGSASLVHRAGRLPAPVQLPVAKPVVVEPPPAPAPKMLRPSGLIRVVITTNPPDATVVIDGRRLGRTPFDGIIKPKGDQIWLKVRKRGYKPRKAKVPVQAELTWDVRLPSKR